MWCWGEGYGCSGVADRDLYWTNKLKARLELKFGRPEVARIHAAAVTIQQFIDQDLKRRQRLPLRVRVLAALLVAVAYLEVTVKAERAGQVDPGDWDN